MMDETEYPNLIFLTLSILMEETNKILSFYILDADYQIYFFVQSKLYVMNCEIFSTNYYQNCALSEKSVTTVPFTKNLMIKRITTQHLLPSRPDYDLLLQQSKIRLNTNGNLYKKIRLIFKHSLKEKHRRSLHI